MSSTGCRPAFGASHPGEALSALLDGELDEGEAERVGGHLAGCVECRVELARLSDARQRLRALNPVPAPPELAQRTREHIGWRRRIVTVAAVMTSALAGLVLWAARPETEVSALPTAAYSLMNQQAPGTMASGATRSAGAPAVMVPTNVTVAVSSSVAQPVSIATLPAGYVAPATLDGMALSGLWRHQGVLAAVYGSPGVPLVLVEQAGRLTASAHQRATVMGSRAGQLGRWGSEATFASQLGPDLVVTVVGSDQDVAEAAGALSGLRANPPWPYRARSLARRLVEELTG